MKLPEGIGFTAEDFSGMHDPILHIERAIRIANEKLPVLLEEWVKREGVKVYFSETVYDNVVGRQWDERQCEVDTHQAYLMLPTEIEK